jgi:5'-3' exonuclease
MQHALIDADILIYRIGFATQDETESTAIRTMAGFLEDLLLIDLPEVQTWELFLTGKNNFRMEKAVTAPYKGTRKSEKPTHYHLLREYLVLSWDALVVDGMEADDMLAIRATELGEDSVIVTLDKDLDQVVGWHYNFAKQTKYYITEEEGKLNFYKQFLTGDTVDNIKGVRGIGPKKADKLLADKTEQEMWDTIVEHLGYDRAIENGHLLYMLRTPTDSFTAPV